jgi:hypothetical protein
MLNRVAGYSGFNSFTVTGVCERKPGQKDINRDYYKHANTVKPSGETYLGSYGRFGSNHQATVDKAVKPSDYIVPSRSGKQNLGYEYLHNPELYKHTKVGKDAAHSQPPNNLRASTELKVAGSSNILSHNNKTGNNLAATDGLYKTTKHWNTNYQTDNVTSTSRPNSQAQRAFWSYPKREHNARRTFFKTEYQNRMGTYGFDPKSVLNSETTKQEVEVSDLTMGTTKLTNHIPGYGGFLVRTDLNDRALDQTKNNKCRELMKNKTNLNENFNVKLPGYSGHKPMSFNNEKGRARPNLFSTQGETFF